MKSLTGIKSDFTSATSVGCKSKTINRYKIVAYC